MSSSRCEPLLMPRRAVLMRDRLLASFEPRRSENPAGGRFALKPTVSVAGHSRDHPPGPPTLRANSSRLRLTLHQGTMCASEAREDESERGPMGDVICNGIRLSYED